MAPEILSASAEVIIVGGSALVGRSLELLLWSADCSVKFLGEPSLGRLALGESWLLDSIRLLILAPVASLRCREAVLELVGTRNSAEARIEILELIADDQRVQVPPWRFLPWPCRTEDLKRQVMATLFDGPGASRDSRDLQTPQKQTLQKEKDRLKKRKIGSVVRVSIEVGSDTARWGVVVRAESIGRALSIAEAFYPGTDVRLVFPIEPEGFFVEDPAATPGPVRLEMLEEAAG